MTPPAADLKKYPRTQHIEGSRLQPGDEDLESVPFSALAGRHIVVEEKLDGANSALSFSPSGELLLQSRGHYLEGGPRETQFDLLKGWATRHQDTLWTLVGARHVVYGEWLYAKHTIFYDALPHYFVEYDVLDRDAGRFLSTTRRAELLNAVPFPSAPVLWSGRAQSLGELLARLGRSRFKSAQWLDRLQTACKSRGLDFQTVRSESDPSDLMEGLYIKVEDQEHVIERYKYVRPSFLRVVLDSGSHWMDRPILPNALAVESDALWLP